MQTQTLTFTSADGKVVCTLNVQVEFKPVDDGGGDDGGGDDGGGDDGGGQDEIPVGGFVNHFPFDSLSGGMSLNQADVILSLVSIAENSDIAWWKNYNYAENNHDGRGITFSIAGFCSGTGDGILVLRELQKINANHKLCKYIPAMSKTTGSNVTGLSGFIADVKSLGDDKEWQQAVWIVLKQLYWDPAMNLATKYGLQLPISKGELYDSAINHGGDSVESDIIRRVKSVPPSQGGNEVVWLKDFLAIRRRIITIEDESLDSGQPDRVDLWSKVLNDGNTKLLRPLTGLVCYGDNFTIA